MGKILYIYFLILILISCSNPVVVIENTKAGKLIATNKLIISDEKKFVLDDYTAPKSPYMQIYNDSNGIKMLTILNPYNNSIYFYDYNKSEYIRRVTYEREGANAILAMTGYYIMNMDSIYVYNKPLVEIILTDSSGKIKEKKSLRTSDPNWSQYYPQYVFKTICPIYKISDNLILTGQQAFSIPDSLINKFHFTACLNLKNNQVSFHHTYPAELYGNNSNWDDPLFMQVYPALLSSGKLIHSFAPSHDLYSMQWNSDISEKKYGGSNNAETIHSIDWNLLDGRTPEKLIISHYLQQDLYAAILFDPWRNIYYRFLQQGIRNATTRTSILEKPLAVILMDADFNYLGETIIGNGKEWNWANSFVTEEGLNIEYIDNNDIEETYMNFKIFTIEKI